MWGATWVCSGFLPRWNEFQSTRPVWGATTGRRTSCSTRRYFNPRAPCGARRLMLSNVVVWWYFNPRAPCGARQALTTARRICKIFQSTRPVWGATGILSGGTINRNISIHAPRVGRDLLPWYLRWAGNISIHAPRVGRDSKFDDFTPSNLHKRYKRVLARPKNTQEKGKIKQKLAYIHAFSAFLGCEGSGTFCALVLRTQYR